MHVITYNVCSILELKRRQILANALALQEIEIVCLSETWLTNSIPSTALFLPDFNIYRGNRPAKSTNQSIKSNDCTCHGGVLIGVRKSIASRQIKLSDIDQTLITGDINFALTNWDTLSSTDTFESHVSDVLIEDGFQQILKDSISGRSLQVTLTNNTSSIVKWVPNITVHKAYSGNGKQLSNHYPYSVVLEAGYSHTIKTATRYSYSTTDWNVALEYIRINSFRPYCFSNIDVLLDSWYNWIDAIHTNSIQRKTEHRTNLPPWITSRTSRILRIVKSLERKQLMRFDAKRFSKISQLTAAALELSKEDLSLFENSVFSSWVFDKIYKYFKVIKCPHSLPSTMHTKVFCRDRF